MGKRITVSVRTNAGEVAKEAARIVAEEIRSRPSTVLGLATGSTPTGCYRELVRLHREEGLSFRNVVTFNLDEYLGLDGDHPQSYRRFMNRELFDQVDIRPWNTHVPNGVARVPSLECDAYEKRILAHGGVDLWLLGIGGNGHIAFNEPGSALDSRTRVVALTPETIAANSDGRFFDNPAEVPRAAITTGIGTIREARRILLLATGSGKANAVRNALQGPFSESCPASLLQDHTNATFLLDRDAAGALD